MIDELTWSLCDEDTDGIMFPQALYTGFTNDVPTRSKGRLVPVSFAREDDSIVLEDMFDAEANTRSLERAYQQSKSKGINVKAVMITKYVLYCFLSERLLLITYQPTQPTRAMLCMFDWCVRGSRTNGHSLEKPSLPSCAFARSTTSTTSPMRYTLSLYSKTRTTEMPLDFSPCFQSTKKASSTLRWSMSSTAPQRTSVPMA
jgi:hypothetical protein